MDFSKKNGHDFKFSNLARVKKSKKFAIFYLHVSQSPHSQLLTNIHHLTTIQIHFPYPAVRPSRGCNGGSVAMQQGHRCMTKAAPRRPKEALTARRKYLFRTKTATSKRHKSLLRKSRKALLAMKHPQNQHSAAQRTRAGRPLRP